MSTSIVLQIAAKGRGLSCIGRYSIAEGVTRFVEGQYVDRSRELWHCRGGSGRDVRGIIGHARRAPGARPD